MKQYKVEYTPAAKADLKSIYTYIAFQLKERTTARNIVNRIRKQIRELDTSPERIFYGGRNIEGIVKESE